MHDMFYDMIDADEAIEKWGHRDLGIHLTG